LIHCIFYFMLQQRARSLEQHARSGRRTAAMKNQGK